LGLGEQWTCLWANDFDQRKEEVFVKNFSRVFFKRGDVSNVKASDLPDTADLAWASFPCQDLSLAGWRQGMTAKRSGVFWEFWRIIRELKEEKRSPNLLAIENVAGLLYGDNFIGLCEALASLGYRFGAIIIDAKHFVPQSRPRVFIVAIDEKIFFTGFTLHERPLKNSIWHPTKLLKTIEDFDPDLKKLWIWWNLPTPEKKSLAFSNLITEPEKNDPSWYSDDEVKKLLGLMNEHHRKKIEDAKAEKGKRLVLTVYKRMRQAEQRAEVRNDGLSGCLRIPGGGSSRQIMIIVQDGNIRARLINRRELARLMGAPDSFWLPNHYNNAYRAMGDAVVVPAVKWLADHILTPLAKQIRQIRQPAEPKSAIKDQYLNRSLKRIEEWKQNGA